MARPIEGPGGIEPIDEIEFPTVASTRPRATGPTTVFVNLGEAEKQANIARDGVAVPIVTIDPRVLEEVVPIVPRLQPRVVSQSIPAGTRVPQGTSIELVLASPFDLPTKIVPDAHVGLAERPLEQVFRDFIRDRDDVRAVLARNSSADTLTDNDRTVIRRSFEAQGLTLDESQTGLAVRNAFAALQAAQTFNA
jgi:hypothetical protein